MGAFLFSQKTFVKGYFQIETFIKSGDILSLWQLKTKIGGLKMQKFKNGDRVKIVEAGIGCSHDCLGEIVTILSYDENGYFGDPGYLTTEIKGSSNNSTGTSGGYIGEKTFELVPVVNWREKLCEV